MFTYHIRDFFGEIFSTCLFFLGLLYLIFEKKNIIASILLALAVANTPAMVVPLFIFLLYWIVVTRNLKYLIILFSAIALMLIENVVKYHSLLNQDYGSAYEHGIKTLLPYSGFPGFSYPMFYGILSIFLSFGKGLVFFSSGILLFFINRPEKDIKKMYFSLFLVGIGLVLIYAKWWAWYGGVYWGPRFFLFFSIISSFIIAYTLTMSVKSFSISTSFIILFVVALSLYVGFNGHTINSNWWEICVKDNYQYEAFSWYVPEFSVLWHPFTTGQVINSTYDIFFSVYIVVVFIYLTIEHHFRILDYCYSKIISYIKSTNKG